MESQLAYGYRPRQCKPCARAQRTHKPFNNKHLQLPQNQDRVPNWQSGRARPNRAAKRQQVDSGPRSRRWDRQRPEDRGLRRHNKRGILACPQGADYHRPEGYPLADSRGCDSCLQVDSPNPWESTLSTSNDPFHSKPETPYKCELLPIHVGTAFPLDNRPGCRYDPAFRGLEKNLMVQGQQEL